MRWHVFSFRLVIILALGLMLLGREAAWGQNTNNNNTNNNNNNNNNGNGNNNGQAGIDVDAQGVLRTRTVLDPDGRVWRERIHAAKSSLNRDVLSASQLRKVSLNRLEKAILEKNGVLTNEMRYLAGLQRVRYVFYYPETRDIVLAGPAEGFAPDVAGRMLGLTSRRPVLQLQDLAVALRAFPAGSSGAELIGCSIDPTQEGLAATQEFVQRYLPQWQRGKNEAELVAGLRRASGMQTVTINGVSPKTHFAQVLVEADYRMKLIGIGLEAPPVRMTRIIDRLGGNLSNALLRFYFTPDYQCVRMSEDGLAMELVGDGVKLVTEDEMVAADGSRHATSGGRGNRAGQAFVDSFTHRYPQIAERSPVYAELRNLIDLSVVAAHIRKQDYYAKADWKMDFLGDEKAFPLETYEAPKQAPPAVSAVVRGDKLTTPIAGGVEIQAQKALKADNRLTDDKGTVAKRYEETKPNLTKGQWWWD